MFPRFPIGKGSFLLIFTHNNGGTMAISVSIRFYEELNDFIPKKYRKKDIERQLNTRTRVRDLVESFGVPHTEVDLVLVNGESVGLEHTLSTGDRLSVYPMFETFNIHSLTKIRDHQLRIVRFILDVHLGKLARLLRRLGFDTLYSNEYTDPEIIETAQREQRIILTRDIGILKNKKVTRGYFVRSQVPRKQVKEVIRRFDLSGQVNPLSRCIECNGTIAPVEKKEVLHLLEPRTRKFYKDFYRCTGCRRIYWEGSHYQKMMAQIDPEG